MGFLRRHLSYANVAATLALVFAMSGTAIAAHHYLITSTSQIKPSVLLSLKGKLGAAGATGATGGEGKAGLPGTNGKDGINGVDGTNGEPGPAGLSGYQIVTGPEETSLGSGINAAVANASCPAGKRVLGGGFTTVNSDAAKPYLHEELPQGEDGWEVITASPNLASYKLQAYAICATVSG